MTFSAGSFVEFLWISQVHPFFASLVWMPGRNRNRIFYVEYELLRDNFKWFPSDFTLEHLCEDDINVFLCYGISDDSLIIFSNRKGSIDGTFK